MQKPKMRLGEYTGASDSGRPASVDDVLVMHGLSKDVRVSEVMDTQSGELCYLYALS
jgi:hypothetical protein